MHQEDWHGPFQQIEHGRPGLARALHGHVGDPSFGEPVRQRQQIDGQWSPIPELHEALSLLPGGSGVIRQALTRF